ncbi:MAG: heavy metal translocating P-type ATPase [Hyphomicrobiales bacterium]
MDVPVDLSGFVKRSDDGKAEIDFAVQGVACAACIGKIEQAVGRMRGAPSARLNYTTRRLKVTWRDGDFQPGEVGRALAPLGYRIQPFDLGSVESEDAQRARALLRCLAVAGFAAMNVMLLSVSVWAGDASGMDEATRDLFHWLSALIALPAAAFAGQPFFTSAFNALRARSLNMDVPISLGISLALVMSLVETAHHARHAYFDSALMLMFFLLLGRVLEHGMRRKTRSVVSNLASLRAPLACRLGSDGNAVDVPVNALKLGDVVLVRPGDRIPVDGVVTIGKAEIDESLITGETRRRAIGPGDTVYAGSLSFDGALRVAVRAAGSGTLLDEIERLLESASTAKSRYVRLADRAARLYAPVVHVTALATALGWMLAGASLHDAVITAIAVLIITCPCALALAVPAVHVVTSGTLFRSGVLLNAGDAIERLAEVDMVVFDKTGTLTLPQPGIDDRDGIAPDLLATAARLALSSHHPLARALAEEASSHMPFDNVREETGRGVSVVVDGQEARLGSADFCGIEEHGARIANDRGLSLIAFRHGNRRAIFGMRQRLRPDAQAVIAWLRRRGLALEILSGDQPQAVSEIAETLAIHNAFGGVKPAGKVGHLAALRDKGCKVLMVGDGLNDAPALAAAHVSLSPATAASVTQAAADAIFLGDRLRPVCAAIAASRKALRLMRENLALAIIYNALAVPLAIAGFVTPLLAAVAMSGSSLLVTLNAMRAHGACDLGYAAEFDEKPVAPAGGTASVAAHIGFAS